MKAKKMGPLCHYSVEWMETYPILYKYRYFISALISYLDNAYMILKQTEDAWMTTGMVEAHSRCV